MLFTKNPLEKCQKLYMTQFDCLLWTKKTPKTSTACCVSASPKKMGKKRKWRGTCRLDNLFVVPPLYSISNVYVKRISSQFEGHPSWTLLRSPEKPQEGRLIGWRTWNHKQMEILHHFYEFPRGWCPTFASLKTEKNSTLSFSTLLSFILMGKNCWLKSRVT